MRSSRTTAETEERWLRAMPTKSAEKMVDGWCKGDYIPRTNSQSEIAGSITIPEKTSNLVSCTSLPFYIHILLLIQKFISLFVFTRLMLKNNCSLLLPLAFIWLLVRLNFFLCLRARCMSSPMCGLFKYLWSYIHLETELWEKTQMGRWGTDEDWPLHWGQDGPLRKAVRAGQIGKSPGKMFWGVKSFRVSGS